MPRLMLGLALLALAACHRQPADVGEMSANEAAQLDNAAEMLDASPDGLSAQPDGNAADGHAAPAAGNGD